jgi:hypothetical protein
MTASIPENFRYLFSSRRTPQCHTISASFSGCFPFLLESQWFRCSHIIILILFFRTPQFNNISPTFLGPFPFPLVTSILPELIYYSVHIVLTYSSIYHNFHFISPFFFISPYKTSIISPLNSPSPNHAQLQHAAEFPVAPKAIIA